MLEVELVQTDANGDVSRHRVRGKKFLVGRHKMCHLQLEDKSVSKTHCVVIKHRNQVLISDLGSRTGTRVNNEVICLAETAPLQHDDRIQLGDSEFTLSVLDKETGEPVFCDADYVGSLPYPFITLKDRRATSPSGRNGASLQEGETSKANRETPKTERSQKSIAREDTRDVPESGAVASDSPNDDSTDNEISLTHRDLDDLQESAFSDDDIVSNDVSSATEPSREDDSAREDAESVETKATRQRIEAVRQKILASNGSSNAASDALQRMFPGRSDS